MNGPAQNFGTYMRHDIHGNSDLIQPKSETLKLISQKISILNPIFKKALNIAL